MTSFSCLLQKEGSTTRLQDSASNSWASLLRSLHSEESTTSRKEKSEAWHPMRQSQRNLQGPDFRLKPSRGTEKPQLELCNANSKLLKTRDKTAQSNTTATGAKKSSIQQQQYREAWKTRCLGVFGLTLLELDSVTFTAHVLLTDSGPR